MLLVDDEKAVLKKASPALTDYSYRMLTADCGEIELEIMADARRPADLVVLDLCMSGRRRRRYLTELMLHLPELNMLIASS